MNPPIKFDLFGIGIFELLKTANDGVIQVPFTIRV